MRFFACFNDAFTNTVNGFTTVGLVVLTILLVFSNSWMESETKGLCCRADLLLRNEATGGVSKNGIL